MKRKLALGIGGLCTVLVVLYALMWMLSASWVEQALQNAGYPFAQVTGMEVYLDGIVIDKIILEPGKELQNVFVQANPFQQMMREPQFLSVKQADIAVQSLFTGKIGFVSGIPFTIEKADFHFKAPLDTIDVTAKIKQNTSTSAMVYFDGKGQHADLSGQMEIYFEDNSLTNINLDFSKIDLDYSSLDTKRADGWLSFIYKNEWQITGELGAGYADLNSLQLADSSITISGTASSPQWNLTGKRGEERKPVSIEQSGKEIKTSIGNDAFTHTPDNNFSLSDFLTAEKDINSLKPLQVVEVTKLRPRPLKKASTETIAKIPADTLQIIENVPKKHFDDLIAHSFFEGLHYSDDLTQIDVPCPDAGQKACWTARARGGVLGYDVLPSYFTRMKDYAASQSLRTILKHIAIKTLAVQGKGGQAQELIINGMSDAGQPVYIALSVADVD